MKTRVTITFLSFLMLLCILCVPAVACPSDPDDPDPPCCPDGCPACHNCMDCSCQCVAVIDRIHILPYDNEDAYCIDWRWLFLAVPAPADIYCVNWSAPGGNPPQDYGTAFSTYWLTPGAKTVTVTTPCNSKQREVYIIDVTDVEWETYGSNTPLDGCPKNGGKRIFPGKKSYDDLYGGERKLVYVKAKITPAIEGARVFLRWWDVDDPSSNTAPIDDNDDTHPTGSDNRGSCGGFSEPNPVAAITNSSGEAIVTFSVSMSPGDNFKIAASCHLDQLSEMTQEMADGYDPLPNRVKLSEMLTVWRKLWIERDSMAAAATTGSEMNHVEGTNASYEPYNPAANRTLVNLGQNLPDELEDLNQFRLGRYITGGTTYTTVESTAYWWPSWDSVKVVGDPTGEPPVYSLYDDDEGRYWSGAWTITPVLPSYPSLGTWASAFHDAYIEPSYLPSSFSDEVPFDRNLSALDVAWGFGSWNDYYDVPSSANFWTVLAVGAFQPEASKDGDGTTDAEVYLGAAKKYFGDNQCVIYYETIGDMDVSATTTPEQDLAHEIGHCAGIEDGEEGECEPGCLMWVIPETGQIGDHFCDKCLSKMRKDDY